MWDPVKYLDSGNWDVVSLIETSVAFELGEQA